MDVVFSCIHSCISLQQKRSIKHLTICMQHVVSISTVEFNCVHRLIIKMELYEVQGQSRLYQLGFGSLVANLVDFHFMSSSSSEGNINNLSINKLLLL